MSLAGRRILALLANRRRAGPSAALLCLPDKEKTTGGEQKIHPQETRMDVVFSESRSTLHEERVESLRPLEGQSTCV